MLKCLKRSANMRKKLGFAKYVRSKNKNLEITFVCVRVICLSVPLDTKPISENCVPITLPSPSLIF